MSSETSDIPALHEEESVDPNELVGESVKAEHDLNVEDFQSEEDGL